jgi:hypothetical protein
MRGSILILFANWISVSLKINQILRLMKLLDLQVFWKLQYSTVLWKQSKLNSL